MLDIITNLGDSALLLPASALLLVHFWAAGERRTALAWGAALALCIGLTFASKIGFRACGAAVLPALDIRSPSGHTALGAAFYGCGALLLGAGRAAGVRIAVAATAAALVVAIAASRVMLEAHTGPEIVAGLLIGAAAVALFRARCFGRAPIGLRWKPLLAGVAALAVLMNGRHLGAEEMIARLVDRLQQTTGVCETAAVGPTALMK